MTPLFPESVSTYIYEYSTIWRSGALLIKMMQRVITSCVTGPCKNCYVFLVLGIASWRYIFSYQDGILQSENSKWFSKEKKKKNAQRFTLITTTEIHQETELSLGTYCQHIIQC